MDNQLIIDDLNRINLSEESGVDIVNNSPEVRNLTIVRNDKLSFIQQVGRGENLSLIILVEKTLINNELERYANSKLMRSSLESALKELYAIEYHITIVDDPVAYKIIDLAHKLPKNRKANLPVDEARQALDAHYTRLCNLDKAPLSDIEKEIIEARKNAINNARKLYMQRQAKTLNVE